MPTEYSVQEISLPPVTDNDKSKENKQVVIEVAFGVKRNSPYPGMSPEDLDRFANTPFWNRFRKVCIALFFILWLSLFIISIALILVYPRCTEPPSLSWWHKSTFYQVFVPSFQDSNGDGIGDLRGLESRLDEVGYLGVDALILSPIFQQKNVSKKRFSEDLITAFDQIDNRLGDMSDVKSLVTAARRNNLRLLLEFPLNHVGAGHPWFKASRDNDSFYSNFFVWSPNRPNNWKNQTGSSAWTYDARKGAFFYHNGNEDQPDLNWRSGRLQQLIYKNVLAWLDHGFDGILMTRASELLEDYEMRNEPANGTRKFTRDVPETIDAIKRLRAAIHSKNDSKILIAEVDSPIAGLRRYVNFDKAAVSDLVVTQKSRAVLENTNCDAKCLWKSINEFLAAIPETSWPANLLGSRRSTKRLAAALETPSLKLLLYGILPGSLLTYYGDEVGLKNTLTPMLWNNTSHGGFSSVSVSPWTTTENGTSFNGAKKQHNSSVSILKTIQQLRKVSPSLQYGSVHLVIAKGAVLGIQRKFDGAQSFLLLMNFGSGSHTAAQLHLEKVEDMPETTELIIDTLRSSDIPPEKKSVQRDAIKLHEGQALLFRWNYIIKEHL